MRYGTFATILLAAAACACACDRDHDAAPEAAAHPAPGVFAVRGAIVFDGVAVRPGAVVVVRDGRIAAVGADAAVPAGAEVIDGRGKTLLPGLIDAHTHAHEGDALEQALALGVTTELGMLEDPQVVARLRAPGPPARASLRSAGWSLTVPGGLGGDVPGMPALEEGGDVEAAVAQRIAQGSDYLELMVDDGSAWGTPHPALSPAQVERAVRAAHAAGKLALSDSAGHAEGARAIDAGVDGLDHLYVEGPDEALARRVAAAGAFVIATLPVLFSVCDGTRGGALADDPAIAPYLGPSAERGLRQSYALFSPAADCAAILAAARQLFEHRVPLLAGSDAGSPGTAHGASLHDGLVLLVEAGLTPAQALAAATSVSADAFHLVDAGRIAEGRPADLVLVDGDATRDVRVTRRIAAVWKGGARVDRERRAADVARARAADRIAPLVAGVIGAFDDDDGDDWQAKSDRVRRGGSAADIALVDDGASGTPGALEVSGTIVPAAGRPAWGGAIRFLGASPPEPADLGSLETLRFRVRGDGRTHRLLLFTLRGGPVPRELATFVATPTWTEQSVSLSSIPPQDRREVVALLWSGGAAAGAFRFQLDGVELR